MNEDTQQSALSVSLLALPETTPTCIYGLLEVFAAVGVTWAQLTGERSTVPRLDARIVAATALPFVTNNGVPLAPAQSLADTERTDIAIVTDLDLSPDGDTRGRWADECAWLLQTLRIEEARQWLEASNESVDAIAHRVGYEDPAYFRRLFKRKVGTTPARYRQRFAIPGGPAIGTVGRSEST